MVAREKERAGDDSSEKLRKDYSVKGGATKDWCGEQGVREKVAMRESEGAIKACRGYGVKRVSLTVEGALKNIGAIAFKTKIKGSFH
jgi:hypothetical protein